MHFRENLIRLRKAKYPSARKFAEVLGIPYNTYLSYENPAKPTEPKYEMLIKIASLLNVSVDKLLDYEPVEDDLQIMEEIETLLNRVHSLSIQLLYKKKTRL